MDSGAMSLEELIAELEQAAEQLRTGELDSAAAADLIERCAELAARLGAELEALARKGEGSAPGQETLL
jgi:exonuclease VII small subunit